MKPFFPSPQEKTSRRERSLLAAVVGFFVLLISGLAAIWRHRLDRGRTAPKQSALPPERMHETTPAHYEKSQLSGRPFIIGAVVFLILMAGIFSTVWGLTGIWSGHRWPHHGPPKPPSDAVGWETKAPQLQNDPQIDLTNLRQREFRRLHAQHWTDASHGFATIPIEDAMRLMSDAAAQGRLASVLPTPQPATPVQLQDQKSRETSPPQVPNP